MTARISRRKLAAYVVNRLELGLKGTEAFEVAAAHLFFAGGGSHEQELLLRDVEDILAERGIVRARVTTAHPLGADEKAAISELIGAKQLTIEEIINDSVIGGIKIDVPGRRFDATLQRKLAALRGAKE